jgi:hypothetical protein
MLSACCRGSSLGALQPYADRYAALRARQTKETAALGIVGEIRFALPAWAFSPIPGASAK